MFRIVLCWFLKIRNRESRFLLPLSKRRNCELKKTIPFRFILWFFWPTIPESIQEKRPEAVKEWELRFFWNRNRHSPTWDGSAKSLQGKPWKVARVPFLVLRKCHDSCTEIGYKVGRRLRESRLLAPSGHKGNEFMQHRDHLLAKPCTVFDHTISFL